MKALVLALCLLATPAAAETYTIGPASDPGGEIFRYIQKYMDWHDEHADVRVVGECVSACTLVLGMIPPAHICATANAEFGFHSASRGGEYAPDMTSVMWNTYPRRVLRVLATVGLGKPIKHPDVVFIEAQRLVQPCGPPPADQSK